MKTIEEVHVYIIGSKGIPAFYGGFETFVEELTKRQKNKLINYHISCMNNRESNYIYNNSECFNIHTNINGPLGKMFQVCDALNYVTKEIQNKEYENVVVYILGCRIGPFLYYYRKKLKKIKTEISIMVNPDGMEWRRSKWNSWQKKFLKYCEKCLVRNAECVIADSIGMKKIIEDDFNINRKKIKYIAYGAEIRSDHEQMEKGERWYKQKNILPMQYYLVVGRFVPENNYELIIKEFKKSNTRKKLLIISNVEMNKFYDDLKRETEFEMDDRIIFAGTVYDAELLVYIRKNAFAYIHGHEVGGTNPSLLEALAVTDINLLLDVIFNREVGVKGARYFTKDENSLANLINETEKMTIIEREMFSKKAKQRIIDDYNWDKIINEYESTFIGES